MIEKSIVVLSRILVLVCSIALVLMMLQVTLDVAGKYFFHTPFPGSEAIVASYYMVAIVFLPLAWVEVTREAIVVEIIYNISNKYIQFLMVILGALATVVCYGFLAWFLWEPAMHAYSIGEYESSTWDVVTWPSKFLLPIGLALGAIVALLQLIRIVAGRGPLVENTEEDITVLPE